MCGVKISPKLVDYDKHEALISGAPGRAFDVVYDGMSGEYAVAGKVIAKIDGYDGVNFTEITDDLLPTDPAALSTLIGETFGAAPDKLRLFLFSHYS
jgi:hypothetical protein